MFTHVFSDSDSDSDFLPSFSAHCTAGIGVSGPFVVVGSAEALNSA